MRVVKIIRFKNEFFEVHTYTQHELLFSVIYITGTRVPDSIMQCVMCGCFVCVCVCVRVRS